MSGNHPYRKQAVNIPEHLLPQLYMNQYNPPPSSNPPSTGSNGHVNPTNQISSNQSGGNMTNVGNTSHQNHQSYQGNGSKGYPNDPTDNGPRFTGKERIPPLQSPILAQYQDLPYPAQSEIDLPSPNLPSPNLPSPKVTSPVSPNIPSGNQFYRGHSQSGQHQGYSQVQPQQVPPQQVPHQQVQSQIPYQQGQYQQGQQSNQSGQKPPYPREYPYSNSRNTSNSSINRSQESFRRQPSQGFSNPPNQQQNQQFQQYQPQSYQTPTQPPTQSNPYQTPQNGYNLSQMNTMQPNRRKPPPIQTDRRIVSQPSQSPVTPKYEHRTKSLSSMKMASIQQGQSMEGNGEPNNSRSVSTTSSTSNIHHTFSLSSKSRSFTSLSKLSSLSTKKFNSSASLQSKNTERTASTSRIASQRTLIQISKKPKVYPAMLSRVANVFRDSMFLTINTKDGLEYHDTFTGKMAVDIICRIIRTNDRNLALLLGRALDSQKLFHDVTYNHRLRDSVHEVYEFNHIYRDVELYDENGERSNSSGDLLQQQLANANLNSVTEETDGLNGVNGVFTILTDCYSPTCSTKSLCYSIACPRRLEQQARLNLKPQGGLKRAVSRLSLHEDENISLWHETVPKSILDKLDKHEKMRQELIYEFIYTERDYVKDLEFMTDFYILPLRNPSNNIIPEREREAFIRTVFGGVNELLRLAKSLSEQLTKRQQQQKPVIESIADVFLQFIDRFDPFIKYSGNKVFASFEHERQQQVNMRYASFLDAIEKRPESRKQDLSSFLIKGVQRPARYQLLLNGILKNTKPESPDYKNLLKAKEEIEKILVKINIQTGESTDRHKIMVLHRLLGKQTLEEKFNFKLSYNNRIIYQVTLNRKRDNEKIDLYLFEHALLLVKHKIQNKREQYKVFEKPIYLPLLYVNGGYDIPTFRTILNSRFNGSIVSDSKAKADLNNKLQINFLGLGSQQVHTTLNADDITNQSQILSQISAQQKKMVEKYDIFSLTKYETRRFSGNNKINCAVPCYGGKKLLYGTDSGVWVSTVRTISITNNEKITSDPTMVISKLYVTQIEVLVEYSKLLILSDKSLYEFDLSCTDSLDHIKNTRSGKLILTHVSSFKTGICDGKLLVCAIKSGNVHQIDIFEPNNPFDKAKKNKKYDIREISFNSEPVSISFLRTRLCIGCNKGFEILSLEEGKKEPILDEADPSLDFAIQKESVSPLAIHRLGKDFLLSYSEFSFLINRNGWRTKHDWGIFWEGNPNNIALFYPYLLSFEPSFIEIRDLESTNLIRSLVGENIRFLHSNEHEAMYACEENGYDVIVSIDFLNLKPKSPSA
ncbi:RHO1 GDP-GTP exchange protein 2 [[Candida] jaroonii]|uniref:RHO1 GDP-GTP exchange protein 2 n=1 Tax=[Candida] jaroonii TaxID=467808 RepID=A0ACA9Y448_9ASCO|nr:RHO1 GDP-GTP exchange protein 2 [[Candida] jaroonii]